MKICGGGKILVFVFFFSYFSLFFFFRWFIFFRLCVSLFFLSCLAFRHCSFVYLHYNHLPALDI